MSQVRKLLETPTLKFQSGGKFWKNNVLVGEGEDVYKQLASFLAGNEFDDVRDYANDFLQQYSTGKEFHTSGNYSNYVPTGRDEEWAKEGTPTGKFWGASFNTDKSRYYKFNQKLNKFNYVAPEKKEDAPKGKPVFDVTDLELDYNPDSKGKRFWSPTALQNTKAMERVANAIAALKDPDNANYELSDDLKVWYKTVENPEDYAKAMWADLQSANWEKSQNLKAYEDWLRPLGIKLPGVESTPKASGSGSGGSGSGSPSGIVEVNLPDGRVAVKGEDGKWSYKEAEEIATETPETEPQETVAETNADTTPTNIRLIVPGERTDMDWGVEYEGKPYSYQYIQANPGSELYNLMQQISANNAKPQGMSDRYTFNNGKLIMPSIEGYSDWTVGQTLEDGTNLNDYFLPLGVTSAAMKHLYTDGRGNRYFKYYNNYDPNWGFTDAEHPESSINWKAQPWNMRRSFYLIVDKDGNMKSSTAVPEQLEPDVVVENSAPVFKAVPYNPAASAPKPVDAVASINPRTMGYYPSNSRSGREPGQLLYDFGDLKIYLTKNGIVDNVGTRYTPEQLSVFLKNRISRQNKKAKKSSGGKINSSKINAFVAKKGGKVLKQQNPSGPIPTFDDLLAQGYDRATIAEILAQYSQSQSTDPYAGVIGSGLGRAEMAEGIQSIAAQQTGNPNAGKLNAVTNSDPGETQTNTNSSTRSDPRLILPPPNLGGDPVDPMSFWRDFAGNTLDVARFASSAYFSNKIKNNRIKTAYEAIQKPTTALFHGYSDATPVEDAQIAQISSLIGNVQHANTSNSAVDNALRQYDWASLLPQLNQVYRYKSQRKDSIDQANVGIANQQSQAYATSENEFKNQLRGARMIEGQAKEDHMRNLAESIQNALLQERAKLSQSLDKFADFDFRQMLQENTNLSESKLNDLYITSGARTAYEADPNKSNYADIEDWIDASPIGAHYKNELRKQIEQINNDLSIANRDAYIKTKIPASYQRLYGKSGGKISIRSKNRYKNEPWEDIWINSNKAAHAAAAKLSDNIIKTFLKTLK